MPARSVLVVTRVPYELCVLVALRDAIRRREVWVAGAGRRRDPEADLPTDFEEHPDHRAAPAIGTFRLDITQRLDLDRGPFAARASISRVALTDQRPVTRRPRGSVRGT